MKSRLVSFHCTIVSLVIAPYTSIEWESKQVTELQCASMCAYMYWCVFSIENMILKNRCKNDLIKD